MKKQFIYTSLIFTLFLGTTIFSQSLSGLKICINPGHGGYDSNDRQISLGNNIYFWESEGNLAKGLHLRDILESLGATVIMSRTQNRTEDDLGLSQIAEIANSNNVDYFHSIHSNAFNGASNYTLILFHGYDNAPTYPQSKVMGAILANKIRSVNRTTAEHNRGDFNFYGNTSGLGVLRPLALPGTLSEGSFHDYTPETWRLKNNSYLKHEAWAIARSFLQYFNAGEFQHGIVAGILRDELEKVPASYNPIGNDIYKPLNTIKVKLEPGNKIYTGDSFNNGYFFFDEVLPGNYSLIYEVEKMKPDTISITVSANTSSFFDKLMVLNPILDPPSVLSYSPADSINEVSNISKIIIDFDIRMNPTETQKALTITPEVAGGFIWENDFKRMIFSPTKSYTPGTKYTVKLNSQAKTHFGIYLPQEKSFSFITRSKLKLISTYPSSGDENISSTVLIRIQFDKGIDGLTLSGKIAFMDSGGNSVSLSVNQAKYSSGIIEFEPRAALVNNSTYKVIIREGIGDVENVKYLQTDTIKFTVERNTTFTGQILEGFETDNIWSSPLLSPNTKGIVSTKTNFVLLNQKKISGSNSGRLEYAFSGKDGNVELGLQNPITIGETSAGEFGIWVFGDDSKNLLQYRFERGNSAEELVFVDTINWTGWKMKKILLNSIPGSGIVRIKGINISQTENGSLEGRLFFDDCLTNIVTGIEYAETIPEEYRLEQNYPNPFNPSTNIRYTIPSSGLQGGSVRVILKVFDLLGAEVATLVDEDKSPGNYQYEFIAKNLASGIYIYRIHAGKFVMSKKFMLLK
jgi:N-acetylmuramoyl-L-alanine amidase